MLECSSTTVMLTKNLACTGTKVVTVRSKINVKCGVTSDCQEIKTVLISIQGLRELHWSLNYIIVIAPHLF